MGAPVGPESLPSSTWRGREKRPARSVWPSSTTMLCRTPLRRECGKETHVRSLIYLSYIEALVCSSAECRIRGRLRALQSHLPPLRRLHSRRPTPARRRRVARIDRVTRLSAGPLHSRSTTRGCTRPPMTGWSVQSTSGSRSSFTVASIPRSSSARTGSSRSCLTNPTAVAPAIGFHRRRARTRLSPAIGKTSIHRPVDRS